MAEDKKMDRESSLIPGRVFTQCPRFGIDSTYSRVSISLHG